MGGLSSDSESSRNFAGLEGRSILKQPVDLTFPIGHELIVTYCLLFVKFSRKNVMCGIAEYLVLVTGHWLYSGWGAIAPAIASSAKG